MITSKDAILVQLRKGVLEYCVMAQLIEAPSYGKQLADDLSHLQSLFASEGTLYPLLARLRRQGSVQTTWQESVQGPPRRYYELTAEGKEAVRIFRNTWGSFAEDVTKSLEGDAP